MRAVLHLLFWFIYFPLLRLLTLFLFWHPKVLHRVRFEKKNKFEALAHSFKEQGLAADLCFEFSSEGEFQQVAPLIDDALKASKKIELVFFSPSVEKAILKLAASYPLQIRYLRYPFLRLFPFLGRRHFSHWTTSKNLIMVRYDLFPEFLLWSLKKEHKLKLVWMTFKKERSLNKNISFWKKSFLKASEATIYATEADAQTGVIVGRAGDHFDFRMEQIKRRIQVRNLTLNHLFPLYPIFQEKLKSSPVKIILGNAWVSDLFLIQDLPKDYLVVIVPHKLDEKNISQFKEVLKNIGRDVVELTGETKTLQPSLTYLINMKGILCELYADFSYAYVGGGFEGSIHSVLEPLVASSQSISCGPSHFRSTEYDIALDLKRISEVSTPEQFNFWVKTPLKNEAYDKMDSLMIGYMALREKVISC